MDWKACFLLVYKSYLGSVLVVGIPLFVAWFAMSLIDWLDGSITTAHLILMIFVCSVAALVAAAFVHYLLLRPYMRSRGFATYEDMKREHDRERERK
jgi:hypothetical protein